MMRGLIFSWAENAEGKMVHIDSVPNGLDCGCFCPHCRRKLIARQGKGQQHHFAHRIDCGEDKNTCYTITLYKLAEQIIQTEKQIHAPSYYGIIPDRDIKFVDVKIYNRKEDNQPDIIATSKEGERYHINLILKEKVQQHKNFDYKFSNSLEVDISKQTLETLEKFLLKESVDRRWLNCDVYFNQIEDFYKKNNIEIKVVNEDECLSCDKFFECRPIKQDLHFIENNGKRYRLCTSNKNYILYNKEMASDISVENEEWLERLINEEREEELYDSLTPIAKQRDWKTPTEFSCCPLEVSENGLEVYRNNLNEGAIFSSNKYAQYYVIDKGISPEGWLIIWGANCDDDRFGDFPICKVEIKFGKYVHTSIHRFVLRESAEHFFKIFIGEEEMTDADFYAMDDWH